MAFCTKTRIWTVNLCHPLSFFISIFCSVVLGALLFSCRRNDAMRRSPWMFVFFGYMAFFIFSIPHQLDFCELPSYYSETRSQYISSGSWFGMLMGQLLVGTNSFIGVLHDLRCFQWNWKMYTINIFFIFAASMFIGWYQFILIFHPND
eukprot:UN03384